MTKQTKAVLAENSSVVAVNEQLKVNTCSVNFSIANFDVVMQKYHLTADSSVNAIMLALYRECGTNLNPAATAKQIRDFKGSACKCSAGCISWYKNHYNAELNKFVTNRKKTNKRAEILDKLYKIDELKPLNAVLDTIPLTKLEQLAAKYELV